MLRVPEKLTALLDAVEELLSSDSRAAAWPTREDDLLLLRATRERLERRYTLAVLGEFSSGKSYLLNALLRKTRYDERGGIAGLLATDINPSTATITELEFGTRESAAAKYPSGREERIPMDRLSRFVAVGKDDERGTLHDATADDDEAPTFVVVTVDSPFLQSGFVVADTPGLASLNPAHRRATLGYLPRSDAALYLIDTQQPFTEGDASFLGLIGEHVRTIFIVQTKIDLWRMPEPDGTPAWEAARRRIVDRAALFAPDAEVFSVSARDYAAATLDGNAAMATASGFPALLEGLERSLEARAQSARVARTLATLRTLVGSTSARVRRALALAESELPALENARMRATGELAERERALSRERDEVARAGTERRLWVARQGTALAERAIRALGSAIDVADIERVRDRGKFHSLVDAAVAPIWNAFAHDVASDVARELERIAKRRGDLRIADLTALRLGGEPGTGAWSRDLGRGIASTIVLGAIGGPTVAFVHAVGQSFATHPYGTYMKRELGEDLYGVFFPALEADVSDFIADLADRIAGVYADASAAIERERAVVRAETLEPIERAFVFARDPDARRAALGELGLLVGRIGEIDSALAAFDRTQASHDPQRTREPRAQAAPAVAFDGDAYDRALRPERYRVVVLGALRRGKSSLINAIAGTRLLQDDGATEALFPVHVRYGPSERAFALAADGSWSAIPAPEAMAHAARSPVLIEVPWALPRELVLVHAPAFDAGNVEAETIALAAARNASEIVGLFSRQLSDGELALYARVSAFEKPMLLAHTIADNESASERRTVVELALRYVRERSIGVSRIFTISALDYLEAAQTKRAAAPWNELGALRETLQAHAEEHMRKSAERSRLVAELERIPAGAKPEPSSPNLRRAIDRLFGRGKP